MKEFAISEVNPNTTFSLLNVQLGHFLEGNYFQRARIAVVFLTFSVGSEKQDVLRFTEGWWCREESDLAETGSFFAYLCESLQYLDVTSISTSDDPSHVEIH